MTGRDVRFPKPTRERTSMSFLCEQDGIEWWSCDACGKSIDMQNRTGICPFCGRRIVRWEV